MRYYSKRYKVKMSIVVKGLTAVSVRRDKWFRSAYGRIRKLVSKKNIVLTVPSASGEIVLQWPTAVGIDTAAEGTNDRLEVTTLKSRPIRNPRMTKINVGTIGHVDHGHSKLASKRIVLASVPLSVGQKKILDEWVKFVKAVPIEPSTSAKTKKPKSFTGRGF